MGLVQRAYRYTNLKRLKCPYCHNDNLMVHIDFKAGRNNSLDHYAKCIIKVKKSFLVRKFGGERVIGCGRIFRLKYT